MHFAPFVAALLISAMPVLAYEIDGSNYCEGPFALCAGGSCQTIPNNSSYLQCTCQVYESGLNVGTSSCAARVNSLISTYAIDNLFPSSSQPPLYTFACTGSNNGTYGSCYGSPCSDNGNGTATCTCPAANGTNHYLGPKCPSTAAQTAKLCAQLRVSSSTTGAPPMESILEEFYGTTPPTEQCNAPGS